MNCFIISNNHIFPDGTTQPKEIGCRILSAAVILEVILECLRCHAHPDYEQYDDNPRVINNHKPEDDISIEMYNEIHQFAVKLNESIAQNRCSLLTEENQGLHNKIKSLETRLANLEKQEERSYHTDEEESTTSRKEKSEAPKEQYDWNQARTFPKIVPGTLWCGVGNMASSYEELGLLSALDACC
ncbi:hypothetical protein DBV15_06765 [Temnothorax longispinosus]|uniref:phospholipase A2 n=1 Tax=Temnothorax longispinosus TaxID=300112 RepID=A0A4S2KZ34_9HYME|nr:hypothetical protein DBV15_06765 [Temnothorax longispinosus]